MNGRTRLLVAIGLGCMAALLAHAIYEAWICDDALISFRYVDNWVAGDGLVFNVGERVEGFSNFSLILMLAPLRLVGANLFVASQIIGVAAAVVELALLLWLLRRTTDSLVVTALGGALFAADRIVAVWTTGGLENSLFGALLFAIIALAIANADRPGRAVVPISLLHVALVATRPEGISFYPLYLGLLCARGWRDGTWKANALRSLNWFLPAVAVLLAARYLYYGEVLANPYYAKVNGVPTAEMGFLYVTGFARRLGLLHPLHAATWAAVVGCAIAFRRHLPTPSIAHAGAYVAAAVVFAQLMGGDYMPDFRLLRPSMAPLYFTIACALSWVVAVRSVRLRAVAAALVLALLVSHSYRQLRPTALASDAPPAEQHKRLVAGSEARAADFRSAIFKIAEPGDAILVDRAGIRGYGHVLRTVDATGLLSKHIDRDFYLRDERDELGVRQRFPGHARWPKVEFMVRERFAFIFPKISRSPPDVPEIRPDSPRRHREYPFVHVVVPLGDGRFLRFFTTLSPEALGARARRSRTEVCLREPWGPLQCVDPRSRGRH